MRPIISERTIIYGRKSKPQKTIWDTYLKAEAAAAVSLPQSWSDKG